MSELTCLSGGTSESMCSSLNVAHVQFAVEVYMIYRQWLICSIQFSLFPAHINMSYNSDNVHIMCRKRGGQKTELKKTYSNATTFRVHENVYPEGWILHQ